MCGIAGFWDTRRELAMKNPEAVLTQMTDSITYRGPDDSGHFILEDHGLGLGHRRLSIVDLSPMGHQPMESRSGRYVIVFNGEIYNHVEMRRDLEASGHTFRGHSDTEVMLAAIDEWGLDAAIRKFNGMFAIALWDNKEKSLSLARDRVGIKPLYYGRVGSIFVFGSELKALRQLPDFSNPVSRGALSLFMRHNYVPAPYSIYEGIWKLRPGCVLRVTRESLSMSRGRDDYQKSESQFWSAREVAQSGCRNRFEGSTDAAVDELEKVLIEAVKYRMVADVPLGAFLSGGIDSSTVVALMQSLSDRAVKTFSIGFNEEDYNEAVHAKSVARHLGTDHTELYVAPNEARDVIPRLPHIYDEPFADSSQIPTFLVSELARNHVTVSLSGDGGDELFSGYNRYFWGHRLYGKLDRVPAAVRKAAAAALNRSPRFWGACLETVMPALPSSWRVNNPRQKVEKLGEVLHHTSIESLYEHLVSHWTNPEDVVIGGTEPPTAVTDLYPPVDLPSDVETMMFTDLISYLPDDILTKVDRASMAVSLEARVPILDHRVVEFAWTIPLEMKIRNGDSKWLLRQVLYRHVPREIMERPKMGFGVPIDDWLRGPLRDWAEALLDRQRLRDEGFLAPDPIREVWNSHISGEVANHYLIWDVLMFQAWLENEGQELTGQPDSDSVQAALGNRH